MKNGNESWDVLGDSRKRYRGPWAEIGKYWPGKEPIRLQDLLPCPLKNEKWRQWVFPLSYPLFKDSSEQLHMRWNLRLCYVQSDRIEETSWGTCFWLFQVFFYSLVMVFVMRTDKENLASRGTQRKTHQSVCENAVSSISKLLTLSHWLFLKTPVWWFL